MTEIKISPPSLSRWLSEEEIKKNILLLDLHGDIDKDEIWTAYLNILFRAIPVRRKGMGTRTEWYVGCSGAVVEAGTEEGEILTSTKSSTFQVNYTNQVNWEQKTGVTLNPEISNGKVKASLGKISFEEGEKQSLQSSFQSNEQGELVTLPTLKLVEWKIDMHRGQKVIRDYLLGNLWLSVTMKWNGPHKAGYFSLRPSDITYFDQDGNPLNKEKSRLMFFLLFVKGIKVKNKDGFKINFEIA